MQRIHSLMFNRILNIPSGKCYRWYVSEIRMEEVTILSWCHCSCSNTSFISKSYPIYFGIHNKKYTCQNFDQKYEISKPPSAVFINVQISCKYAAQKKKFPIKDFFSKCDQIGKKLQIWSYLLKKSLTENFIFY